MALQEQEKHYTAKDLWEMSHRPENEGKRLILIDGRIHEMSPAGWKHGEVAGAIFGYIWNFVREQQLGRVTAAETGFDLAPGTTLAPDVGFIAAGRVPDELPSGYVPFAPDLAVEVVSPGNTATDIRTKVEKYIQHGTRLVWVIYPEQQKVDVYRSESETGAHVNFLSIDGTLDGGDVLTGFTLKVKNIFPTKEIDDESQ